MRHWESEEFFRLLLTENENEAVSRPGKGKFESQVEACERLECGEDRRSKALVISGRCFVLVLNVLRHWAWLEGLPASVPYLGTSDSPLLQPSGPVKGSSQVYPLLPGSGL